MGLDVLFEHLANCEDCTLCRRRGKESLLSISHERVVIFNVPHLNFEDVESSISGYPDLIDSSYRRYTTLKLPLSYQFRLLWDEIVVWETRARAST